MTRLAREAARGSGWLWLDDVSIAGCRYTRDLYTALGARDDRLESSTTVPTRSASIRRTPIPRQSDRFSRYLFDTFRSGFQSTTSRVPVGHESPTYVYTNERR